MARKQSKKVKNRTFSKKIKFYVEGQTEKLYLNHIKSVLNLSNLKFEIKEKGSSVLQEFNQDTECDVPVLAIVDIDANPDKNIKVDCTSKTVKNYVNEVNNRVVQPSTIICQKLSLGNINYIFYTNYSFELFLLNHKVSYKKADLNDKNLIKAIEKTFGINEYKKTKQQIENILLQIQLADIETCLDNISGISSKVAESPSCNLDELLSILKYHNFN